MAITETQTTATVGATEWSMATNTGYDSGDAQTGDGVMQAWFDVSALTSGDQFQIRFYEKIKSSGTQRVVHEAILTGAQSQGLLVFPALTVMHGWDATAKKLAGTDRSIDCSLRLLPAA
ncbi:MAG: hypothetical protein AB7F98_02535 [Novosphingobium sp.]